MIFSDYSKSLRWCAVLVPRDLHLLLGTSIGRSKWLSLLSGSKLQPNCNSEGINAMGKVRIGIGANEQNDCSSPDSFLGVGTRGGCSTGIYSGNYGCHIPNWDGVHKLPADVSILIR